MNLHSLSRTLSLVGCLSLRKMDSEGITQLLQRMFLVVYEDDATDLLFEIVQFRCSAWWASCGWIPSDGSRWCQGVQLVRGSWVKMKSHRRQSVVPRLLA